MPEIIVAGCGHGGITAAIKLAAAGFDVTVFEKEERSDTGLPQYDAFDIEAMEYAGFTAPESWYAPKNQITFVPLDKSVEPVTLPTDDGEKALFVDRKELIAFLIDLAEKNGVEFRFGCEVKEPVMLGNRVAGIRTSGGIYYADLIIDALGVNSQIRTQLPEYLNIQKTFSEYDVLHTYRAYFERNECVPEPKTKYNIYIKDDGTVGFKWLVTEKNDVDVLIAHFPQIDSATVLENLRVLN